MFLLDDFFPRAVIAGIGFAIVAGPLGCFVVWQRMAYLGESMAHSALLGVALALALDINLLIGVFCICIIIAVVLAPITSDSRLSRDSTLGIVSHSTLSIGLVLVSTMYWIRVDVLDILFGNIIAVSWSDISLIIVTSICALGIIIWKWRSFISLTLNDQIAASEGMNPLRTRALLMVLLAMTIAIAMKIVGVILTVALMIIPAATARQISRTPEQMAVLSAILGAVAVIGGLFMSLEYDTPPGPSIVVTALAFFLFILVVFRLNSKRIHP